MGKSKNIDASRRVFSLRLTASQRRYFDQSKKTLEEKGYKVTISWVILKMLEHGQEGFEDEWLNRSKFELSKLAKGRTYDNDNS